MNAVRSITAAPCAEVLWPAVEMLEGRLLLSVAHVHKHPLAVHHAAAPLVHHAKKPHGDGAGQNENGGQHGHPKPKPKPGDGGDDGGDNSGNSDSSGSAGGGTAAGSGSGGSSGSAGGSTSGSGGQGSSGGVGTPTPVPVDAGPAASIYAPDVTAGGANPQTVTVTYTGAVGVNPATIAPGNLAVTGPAGALAVTGASAGMPSGTSLIATYTIAPPGAGWTSAANGTYTVSLKANQVFDTGGAAAGGAQGSFKVQVAAPAVAGGAQDPTFGGGSGVGAAFVTEAILTESNGKMLVVGHKGDASAGQGQGVIEQLNTDGSVDTSFGTKGEIATAAGANEEYFAAAWQDAKHFVVAGSSKGDFLVRRFNLGGTVDATFGTKGTVTADFGTAGDSARAVVIGSGGNIVAGGDSGGNFAFARFLPSGKLDANFAQAGRQMFGLGQGNNGLGAIAIQGDGKIVAAGAEGAAVVAVRLTGAGEADGTFGSGGMVTVGSLAARTDLGEPDRSEGLGIAGNGNILVANRTAGGNFGLVSLNSNGTVDTTFGTKGLATADFGGDDDADSVVVENQGQILVVGTSLQSSGAKTAVAAFNATGALDRSFGTQGLATFDSGISAAGTGTLGGIAPKSLHVGDIVLKAFGSVTPDGRVVIGTTNQAVAATTSSTLRRLLVPGAASAAGGTGTLIGSFGIVGGHLQKLTATINGAKITFSLSGGTGNAYQDGNQVRLSVDDAGKGVAMAITSAGGRVALGDVAISGTLRLMNAKTSDLGGNLRVTGAVGSIALGDVAGNIFGGASIANLSAGALKGTIFATDTIGRARLGDVTGTIASGGGVIGSVSAGSMTNGRILSGANLGDDGLVGGTGASQDTFRAGSIGFLRVGGDIASSFVGAGVDPVDATFGNSNDKAAGATGTAAASLIRRILARSADGASRFEGGSFGQVVIGKSVDAGKDARFRVLT